MRRIWLIAVLLVGMIGTPALADRVTSDVAATQRKLDRFYTFLDRALDEAAAVEFRQQQIRSAERARKGLERRLEEAERAALDAELARVQQEVSAAAAARSDERAERAGLEDALRVWMTTRLVGNWTRPEDTVAAQARFRAYRAEARRLAAASTEDARAASPSLQAHCQSLAAEGAAPAVAKELANLEKRLSEEALVEPVVLEIEAMQVRFEAGALLCSAPSISRAARSAAALAGRIGGIEGASAQRAAAVRAAAAKVHMKPAARKSAELERRIEETFVAQGWKEPVLALRLAGDWEIVRHPATGVMVGRIQEAQIAVKLKDGSCRLYDFRVFQDAKGKALRRKSHSSRPMACTNVPKGAEPRRRSRR